MELAAIVYQSLIVFSSAFILILFISFIAHKAKKNSSKTEYADNNYKPTTNSESKLFPAKEQRSVMYNDVQFVPNYEKNYKEEYAKTSLNYRYEIINKYGVSDGFNSKRRYYIPV